MEERSWHREQIKAAVRMTGVTLAALALANGLHEGACRQALLGRHPRAEAAIAERIKVPLWELWPSRWKKAANGTAIRIDHRKKSRTGRKPSPVKRTRKL